MYVVISNCFLSIQAILKALYNYFESSLISTLFFTFLIVIAFLNAFKMFLVRSEKKNGYQDQPCRHLCSEREGPMCRLPSCVQEFKARKNSCEGCNKKSTSVPDEEVAERVSDSSLWKCFIVRAADYGRAILPYVSFLYTLIIAIYEK